MFICFTGEIFLLGIYLDAGKKSNMILQQTPWSIISWMPVGDTENYCSSGIWETVVKKHGNHSTNMHQIELK